MLALKNILKTSIFVGILLTINTLFASTFTTSQFTKSTPQLSHTSFSKIITPTVFLCEDDESSEKDLSGVHYSFIDVTKTTRSLASVFKHEVVSSLFLVAKLSFIRNHLFLLFHCWKIMS